MRFSEPIAWTFASLALVLLYLYFRPRPRRAIVVPAVFLWPDSPPRQQRRWDPLLLLQLLALGSLVAALAGPYREHVSPTAPKSHVLVLDRSASMQATDAQGTRFAAAKVQALDYLNALRPGDRVAVVAVSEQPEIIVPFSTDHDRVAAQLTALEPYDSAGSLAQALALAQTLANASEPQGRIAVFSDFADADVPPSLLAGAASFPIGRSDRNVGITELTLAQRPWQTIRDSELTIRVRNYGSHLEHGLLAVEWQGRPLLRQGITLPPRESDTVIVERLPGAGMLSIKLTADDLLATDNEAAIWVPEPQPLRLCVTSAQPWPELQTLAQAVPGLRLGRKDCATGTSPADIYLFHRARPPEEFRYPALVIDPPPQQHGAGQRSVRELALVAWDVQHPIFSHWTPAFPSPVKAVGELAPPTGAVPILWGRDRQELVPVAWAAERPARQVWLGFDLAHEPALSVEGFPLAVFLLESLSWLRPVPAAQEFWSVGKPYPLNVGTPAVVRLPNGSEHTLLAEGSFTPHWRGHYEVRGPGGEASFVAVAMDARESDIAPKLALPAAHTRSLPEQPTRTRIPWGSAVLTTALVLLLLEAWASGRLAAEGRR
ncbi:MAG: VWA domain-containing protein [Candidatus Binatia bacterium]|nr:VWA domain-containing protein [Candidatus Binatia bacterium]